MNLLRNWINRDSDIVLKLVHKTVIDFGICTVSTFFMIQFLKSKKDKKEATTIVVANDGVLRV